MNIIKQNPFRILGITGNVKEKELQKQLSKIKAYTRVGKKIKLDYDLPFLGILKRDNEIIQDASSKIVQADKKLIYALFWFINNSKFDNIALNYLKDNQIDKAIEVWNKTLKDEITTKNCSSYQNISSLYIALSIVDNSIDIEILKKGIYLKGKILNSDNLISFSKIITGNEIIKDKIKISKKFVDEIIELLKPFEIYATDLISLFNNFPTEIKKYVSAIFTEVPISNIENAIDKTIKKRKDYPGNSNFYGKELYKLTNKDLSLLKNILGNSNLQLQIIADKIANEIIQCSIDFFNKKQEINNDEYFEECRNNAIELVKLAKSIAVSEQILNRADENINMLNDMKDRAINRAIAILNSIKLAYEKAIREIDTQVIMMSMRMSYNQTINYSKVDKIKANCLDWPKVVEVISNEISINDVKTIQRCSNQIKVSEYKNLVDFLFNKLGPIQINQVKYLCYWKEIRATQAKAIANKVGSTTSSATDGGCYIATMAYGDYDHPQVMILREFRDKTLSKSFLGRSFIKFYYATSPHLVKLLKNQKYINKLIRNLLDRFINKVK